jgi:hypothetical protein
VAEAAAAGWGLFAAVAVHRVIYFLKSEAARKSPTRGSLSSRLKPEHQATRTDNYKAMGDAMFYEDPFGFYEILRLLGAFERRFNAG